MKMKTITLADATFRNLIMDDPAGFEGGVLEALINTDDDEIEAEVERKFVLIGEVLAKMHEEEFGSPRYEPDEEIDYSTDAREYLGCESDCDKRLGNLNGPEENRRVWPIYQRCIKEYGDI